MRVLLISTYELGHQPLHVASPAGALLAAGHEVRALDLAVEPFDEDPVLWAEALAISVPMHTAFQMAATLVERVHRLRPTLPVALYGLYAGVPGPGLEPVAVRLVGEYERELIGWIDRLGNGVETTGTRLDRSRQRFRVPARELLPELGRYAHLSIGSEHRVSGYVETGHGCRHRCRHCPVPVVYDGRFRVVAPDTVLADIDQQVRSGARHITFGDPDFLNGPVHAMGILRAAHGAFPDLTFDATVKVEHILQRPELLPQMAAAKLLFLVSAFETVDDRTLARLDKGHTAEGMARAVDLCREHGIEIHPTWLPFTPWTGFEELLGIFSFLDRHDLLGQTDPVQMTIRLLIPPGSLLLELPDLAPHLGPYDPETLSHRWVPADPRMDSLQAELAAMAESAIDEGSAPVSTLVDMWRRVLEAAGHDPQIAQVPAGATTGKPRLTEPWFC